jgi:enoyl-CoA hydratase/carnithine racemase
MSVSVRNEDGVSIITIDRPDAANAINADVGEGIAAAIAAASADRHTLGAVLTGAGERVFSAGADLKNPANLPPPDLAARRSATLHTLLDAVLGFPKPLVAALNGAAVGAGAMVALLCDRVVCVPTGRFSLPEIDVGMPTPLGLAILTDLAGSGVAADLVLSGRPMLAAEAEARGLLRCVAAGELLSAAIAAATELGRKPALAFAQNKEWLQRRRRAGIEAAMADSQAFRVRRGAGAG